MISRRAKALFGPLYVLISNQVDAGGGQETSQRLGICGRRPRTPAPEMVQPCTIIAALTNRFYSSYFCCLTRGSALQFNPQFCRKALFAQVDFGVRHSFFRGLQVPELRAQPPLCPKLPPSLWSQSQHSMFTIHP